MTMPNEHCVSLIALGLNQAVPARVSVTDALLPSLRTAAVCDWIAHRRAEGLAVFAVPGRVRPRDHRTVLVVEVGRVEYERLSAIVPPGE